MILHMYFASPFGMILGVAYNTAGRVAVLFVSSGVVAVGAASPGGQQLDAPPGKLTHVLLLS